MNRPHKALDVVWSIRKNPPRFAPDFEHPWLVFQTQRWPRVDAAPIMRFTKAKHAKRWAAENAPEGVKIIIVKDVERTPRCPECGA